MQYQVPQFIETEDKIIGPLSLRQFFYVGGAGAVSLFLYFTVATWLWFLLSLILVGAGIAFAFVKVNGRPLAKAVLAAFFFYWKPQRYVWQPDAPHLKKEEVLKSSGVEGAIAHIVSGFTLKHTWEKLQTGMRKEKRVKEVFGNYEVFERATGERQVARRIDYR